MHLEFQIVIHRETADIWRFLGCVENVARWDRGVVRTTITSSTAGGIGMEFSTFARKIPTGERCPTVSWNQALITVSCNSSVATATLAFSEMDAGPPGRSSTPKGHWSNVVSTSHFDLAICSLLLCYM